MVFYLGLSFGIDVPEDPSDMGRESIEGTDPWCREVWLRQRIGLATSHSLEGPWTRRDDPILLPRPGLWDSGTTANPSPCVMPDGSIYLAYTSGRTTKGTALAPFRVGIARADAWNKPFQRLSDLPCFDFSDPETFVEDPFLWHADGCFHLIMKDLSGHVTGDRGSGLYLYSDDFTHKFNRGAAIRFLRAKGECHPCGRFAHAVPGN